MIRSVAREEAQAAGGLVRLIGPPRISAGVVEALSCVYLPDETVPVLNVSVANDARTAEGTVEGAVLWSIPLSTTDPVSALLGQIVGTLTSLLTRLLFIHAGVVAFADRAMIIIGHSGAGKTSTVAALVRSGAAYLSDEVALLDPPSGTVVPFLLPMAVKPWTRRAAGALPPGRRIISDGSTEFWLPRDLGSPTRVGTFVLLRGEKPEPRLARISPAQMLLAMADHASSFKQEQRVREAFTGFAQLLRTARCVVFDASRPAAHPNLLEMLKRAVE